MKHSTALVTGTTSWLDYAAAHALAGEDSRDIIVTGRRLRQTQETAAQPAAETKTRVLTPMEPEIHGPTCVQSALAVLTRRLPSVIAL